MKSNKLIKLGILAFVMITISVVVNERDGKKKDSFIKGSYFIQGVNPDEISKITISSGEKMVTFVKDDKSFNIADKSGYTADRQMINKIFEAILNIKIRSKVALGQKYFAGLGNGENPQSIVVRFFNETGRKSLGVLIGKIDDECNSNYVRREGAKVVYTTDKAVPDIKLQPEDYYTKRLLVGSDEDFNRVIVSHEMGGYEIARRTKGIELVDECLAGKTYDSEAIISVFHSLVHLNIKDVMPLNKFTGTKLELTATLFKNDKTIYHFQFGKMDDRHYVVVTPEIDYLGDLNIRKNESLNSLRKKEKILVAGDVVQEFRVKHEGWIYLIDQDTIGRIKKNKKDFLIKSEYQQN